METEQPDGTLPDPLRGTDLQPVGRRPSQFADFKGEALDVGVLLPLQAAQGRRTFHQASPPRDDAAVLALQSLALLGVRLPNDQ